MNEKYYQIALRNVFLPNPKTEIVYAYLDCGIYRELLTKKKYTIQISMKGLI